MLHGSLNGERGACHDDDVGVLSNLDGADAVSDADVLGRIDGDGAECVILVHAGFDGKARAERQVVERRNRCIGDDGNLAAGLCKDAGRIPGLILKLELGSVSKGRAYG